MSRFFVLTLRSYFRYLSYEIIKKKKSETIFRDVKTNAKNALDSTVVNEELVLRVLVKTETSGEYIKIINVKETRVPDQ